jgi:hypothetical protein
MTARPADFLAGRSPLPGATIGDRRSHLEETGVGTTIVSNDAPETPATAN